MRVAKPSPRISHLDGPGGQMPLVSTGDFERNVAPHKVYRTEKAS